ncbi:MAG: 3-oxoacyl-ACP reductase FabG [Flavobacteriales bacterium]|nr:3-oxoacyl-ACP reductase FabG [Flavobacteriales bacterium]MCX7768404.1 3-oxoacyl-ACP reductase FabG [Flavobacteriales bacterium]MDW8409703.1 3-oxoacyl-ACP reductase FabG [Flavobacteriales bacterium]
MEKLDSCALITGGSRGIGRAVAVRLARPGRMLIINYLSNHKAAEETKRLAEERGAIVHLVPFDCSDAPSVQDVFAELQPLLPEGGIDILVNNAGIRRDQLMVTMEPSDWHRVIDVHLHGFFYITRAVLPSMVRRRRGRIVNIVSLSGVQGMPGQTNYAAAKAAVIGATKSLAREVARRQITVNAVAPGFIRTDMIADISENDYKAIIPAGRFGNPEEVAAVVAFLCSEEASYITGEVIHVNGGLYT